MKNLFLLLTLGYGALSLPAQEDIFIHTGFAGATPNYSVPITRFLDLNGDGIYDPAKELFAFQRKYHSLAAKNCFIMGLTTTIENGRIVYYGADSGDNVAGESYLFRSIDMNGDGVIQASESVIFADFGKLTSGHSPDSVAVATDHLGRLAVYATNNAPPIQGLWKSIDLNNDGDALDQGETTIFANTASALTLAGKSGPTKLSFTDLNKVITHPRSGVLTYNNSYYKAINPDSYAWLHLQEDTKGNPVVGNFFNPSARNDLPRNVDFATGKIVDADLSWVEGTATYGMGDICWLAVSPKSVNGKDAYYFATYCKVGGKHGDLNKNLQKISGLIFRGIDLNDDGDLNDSAEVNLFYNGTGTTLPGGTLVGNVKPVIYYENLSTGNSTICNGIDGLAVWGNRIYVAYEAATNSPGILLLEDSNHNRVIETGEAKQVLWMTTPLPALYSTRFGCDLRGIVVLPKMLVPTPQPAGVETYGAGGIGANALRPLTWSQGGMPQPGNSSFEIILSRGLPGAAAILFLGDSNRQSPGLGKLPLALDGVGMTGCSLLTNPTLLYAVNLNTQGQGKVKLPIPNLKELNGLGLFGQFLTPDKGANPVGLVTSDGLKITVQ